MKKMINQSHIEGLLYEHKLELRTSGPTSKHPGTEFIMGDINVATDNDCTNIVPVHFTYVTEKTAKGNTNSTFTTLKGIIDGKHGTVMGNGKDKAVKLRIDSAIALNEFYTNRNDTEELVSVKRNEGGFIHVIDALSEDESARNTFKCDMLITKVSRIEADEERNIPERAIVHGAIFNFRNDLLPVDFTAVNPNAMNYFEGLDATGKNPVFTKLWGQQVSETVVREIREESAFGDDSVREVKSTRKDFVITGASKDPYAWDDEETITATELAEKLANRETELAALKQRQDEYRASKGNAIAETAAPSKSGFNF